MEFQSDIYDHEGTVEEFAWISVEHATHLSVADQARVIQSLCRAVSDMKDQIERREGR